MVQLIDFQAQSFRTFPITKNHLFLEHMVPALLIKDPFDQDLFAIPFNHVLRWEVSAFSQDAQAILECFDPTFRTLSLLFFNAAQGTGQGLSIRVRWGWVNRTTDPAASLQLTESVRNQFLSQSYKFYVVAVTENQEPNGNRITVNMLPHVFDPVLSNIKVTKTFVSSNFADASKRSNVGALESEIQRILGGDANNANSEEFQRYKRTLDAFRNLRSNVTNNETNPIDNNTTLRVSDGKLTFQKIFNELLDIAEENQNRLGIRRATNYQRPLIITPDNIDDEYDYQIFEGRNDSIWVCLRRLSNLMLSKDPPATTDTGIQTSRQRSPNQPRHRMVGGKMTMHNARLKNPAKQIIIKNARGRNISAEQAGADQESYLFFSFKEAPYDFMLKSEEPPIGTYVFYGGSKQFDINNTSDILSFSVQNMDTLSTFFMDKSLFTITSATNPTTNESLRLDKPAQVKAADIVSSVQNLVRENAPRTETSDQNSTVTEQGQIEPLEDTNPANDRSRPSTSSTALAASPLTGSNIQEFDIPYVVSQDGERMSQAAERFLDILRTAAGRQFNPELEITIVGDPRLEPTFANGQTDIRLIFRNRFGEDHPLYSGIYLIRDIKHIIEAGNYTTVLKVVKRPFTATDVDTESPEVIEAATGRRYGDTEPIPAGFLTVTLTGSSENRRLIISDAPGSPGIKAFAGNPNANRVSGILKRQIAGAAAGKTIIQDLYEQFRSAIVVDQVQGITQNRSEATQTLLNFSKQYNYVDGRSNRRFTITFKVKEVV